MYHSCSLFTFRPLSGLKVIKKIYKKIMKPLLPVILSPSPTFVSFFSLQFANVSFMFFIHFSGLKVIKKNHKDLEICLTLFHTASENPYPSRGGPPRPPPRISGTLTHKITTLGGNTHLGINSLYTAFHALKIKSYCLKVPEIGLKWPTKAFKLKTKITQER